MRPASSGLLQRLWLRLYGDERGLLIVVVLLGSLATHTPHPRRVVAVVSLKHLTLIGEKAGELSQELEGIGSLTARGGTLGLVRVVGDGTLLSVVLHAVERNRISGTRTGQADGELLVIG